MTENSERSSAREEIDQATRLPGSDEEARGLIRVYEKALDKSLTRYKSNGVLTKFEEVEKREIKTDCW
jgi:hypothetical protein